MTTTNKLIKAWLGVSRPIYVNVDSPNLGFTYFNFLGGFQLKKTPCNICSMHNMHDLAVNKYFAHTSASTGGKQS